MTSRREKAKSIQTRPYGKDINDNICQDSDDGAKWQLDPYNDILLGQLTIKEQGFMNTPTRSHIFGEYCLTITKD